MFPVATRTTASTLINLESSRGFATLKNGLMRLSSIENTRAMSSSPPKSPASAKSPAATKSPSTPAEKPKSKSESFLSRLTFFGMDSVVPGEKIKPSDIRLPDTVEVATGETKMYLLAFENGIMDPYCTLPIERKGRGSKDNPVEVPSFEQERLVGCHCEEHTSIVRYTTLYKGELKRCMCGHYLKMVDPPKFWEQIPEEDMMTIKAYRDWKEAQTKAPIEAKH